MKEFLKNNWLLLVAALYLILPVDIIPDDLPLVGSIDDFLVLMIELVRRQLEHRQEQIKVDKTEKTKKV